MSIKRKYILALSLLMSVLLTSCVAPYYNYFAYADGSSLPAKPWLRLPDAAPQHPSIIQSAYRQTGNALLSAMDAHRSSIGAAGISAAVLVGNEVVWAATSGWGDIETDTPLNPATRFRIGSTSKALTATGLARLVEIGMLSLDTPLSDLWEELPNEKWAAITPRQLASHMAGLPHYGSNGDITGLLHSMKLQKHYDSVHDAITLFDDSGLLFPPGTSFAYSSYGTVLNSAAMSIAAGKPFLELMSELVFEPTGMDGVIVAPADSDSIPDMATPYHRNGRLDDKLRLRPWADVDLSHRLAGGGFAATSTDLVKIGRSYFAVTNPNAIPEQIREEFWTPQRLSSGEVNEQNYALGWRVREAEFLPGITLRHVNHGGVSRGGQSWLMLLPEVEIAVAININGRTDDFSDFASFYVEIVEAFLTRKLALNTESVQTN